MIVKDKCKSLYAPWRKEYVSKSTAEKESTKDREKCPFCSKNKDSKYSVFETKRSFIKTNKYPYAAGHLLVIPKRHVNQIFDLTTLESKELFNLINLSVFMLDKFMKPEGYNIGCSIGRIAGESIQHLHFHILPRYKGDVGWNRLCDFNVVSVSPIDLATDLRKLIQKEKLAKKFGF
ncbi:MAG TPA: HIT domain-containing protein [archaeon]|jgi:ATP adenylyltransferase|nr:HIT domain-containing protein [archaeon]HPV65848.1 HIT domain-containing protein [archaeon]